MNRYKLLLVLIVVTFNSVSMIAYAQNDDSKKIEIQSDETEFAADVEQLSKSNPTISQDKNSTSQFDLQVSLEGEQDVFRPPGRFEPVIDMGEGQLESIGRHTPGHSTGVPDGNSRAVVDQTQRKKARLEGRVNALERRIDAAGRSAWKENDSDFVVVSFRQPAGLPTKAAVLEEFPGAIALTVAFGDNPQIPITYTGNVDEDMLGPVNAMLSASPEGTFTHGMSVSESSARIIGVSMSRSDFGHFQKNSAFNKNKERFIVESSQTPLHAPVDFNLFATMVEEAK